MNVGVEGQLVFGTSGLILMAARSGFGLAYPPEEQVRDDLESGSLVRVLADWCPPFSGYHLYSQAVASQRRRSRSGIGFGYLSSLRSWKRSNF